MTSTGNFWPNRRSAVLLKLSMDDLIRLKEPRDLEFICKRAKAEGILEHLRRNDAIRAKNHDITAEFIRRAKAEGYGNVGLDELIRLNNRGQIK